MAAVGLLLFSLVTLLLFLAAPSAAADKFVVGGGQHWAPGVNYTAWAAQHHFHVGDWLVFHYQKDMYDVVQVGEAAYAACDASDPIVSYSRGRGFPFRLNRTGRFYFICSRGYCWNGMKVSVLAEAPSPPPAAEPSMSAAAGAGGRDAPGVRWALATAAAAAAATAVLGLPFAV